MSPLRLARAGTVLLLSVVLAAAGASTTGCGGEPPEKEMQQAQGAIDAARAAGAHEYAAAEYEAAVTALDRAHKAAADRDYRQALNDALDARDRAQTSARMAADNMATARVEADRAVAAAGASLDAVRKHLAELDAAKAPAKALAGPRKAIDEAAGRLQEARTAFDQKHYTVATTTASAASKAIITAGAELDGIASPAARRGR